VGKSRVILLATAVVAYGHSWQVQPSNTTVALRGVSAIGDVVWYSGAKGTVATPRGVATLPGAADLDFRDVEAFDDSTAYLMSSGKGQLSRIYKTTNGGSSWALLHTNLNPEGFFDCMSFWDAAHGIVVGDPVDGRFTILTTADGSTWQRQKGPPANKDEAAFAASGSCVFTRGTREAWFATGGPGGARVFHSNDAGQTWSVAKTPLRHDSASAGIFSIAFSDAIHGIAVGGDFSKPEETMGNIAITEDGGKTWTAPAQGPSGYRSAVIFLRSQKLWITTGTTGSDSSPDGKAWNKFNDAPYNSLSGEFAAGPNGALARLSLK
jgi:photosystem II stability/assembly factor-like uncharacterized protein